MYMPAFSCRLDSCVYNQNKQIDKIMIEKNSFYESPRIETIELENESILCLSGDINSLNDDDTYNDIF